MADTLKDLDETIVDLESYINRLEDQINKSEEENVQRLLAHELKKNETRKEIASEEADFVPQGLVLLSKEVKISVVGNDIEEILNNMYT